MSLISSAIAESLREQDLIPDALENLAKSSTRGLPKPEQNELAVETNRSFIMIKNVVISLSSQIRLKSNQYSYSMRLTTMSRKLTISHR